jgi:hypothetical protein
MKIFPADKIRSPAVTWADNTGDTDIIKQSDSTIETQADGGYKQTRPRNTRHIKTFAYSWTCLTDAELKTIMDFYDSVGKSDMFAFTDYNLKNTYTVRMANEPSYQLYPPNGWAVSLAFEEV